MSFGHSEVSFNHSCLKVPVDALNRRPSPKYERILSGKKSVTKQEDKKDYPFSDFTNYTSVKKYLEFYESIPDYSELHHLSNEEFYSRLKSLKITQKRLCGESGIWSAPNSEDEIPNGRYNYDYFGSLEKEKKNKIKKPETSGVCGCSMCSSGSEYCRIKPPPPKINIISDNENASDLFEPEFKKHSDYEADQESSTLQIGEKLPVNRLRNRKIDDCLLDDCSRRSRSLPISPACECESAGLCNGFYDVTYRNECRLNSCNSSKKDTQSLLKKSTKSHSRPVPLTSRIPLFDKIMMEKEARRKAIHDLYSEELRSLVKPFSFTKREEEKERLRMISSNPELTSLNPPLVHFRAKPVPKHLFSNYAYEKMREDEFYRALKRRVRAEEMLKASSLPPSMALREKKFRSKSLDFLDYRSPKRSWNKTCGYRRACKNIKREIEFDEKIKNGTPQKRKQRSGWISNTRRINSATDSSTEISPYESILSPEKKRKGRPHSAYSCSRNNLASVLRIQTASGSDPLKMPAAEKVGETFGRRRMTTWCKCPDKKKEGCIRVPNPKTWTPLGKRMEKEMEEKLRENRQKDHARFKAHLARMDPAWRALRYDKNEDLALRMAARRREERLKKENHQRLMESMYGRVYSMPPLFHNERFSNGKNISFQTDDGKDTDAFSYNLIDKRDNETSEPPKDSKSLDFSSSFDNQQNYRSPEFPNYSANGEKNEKEKAYESDDATTET